MGPTIKVGQTWRHKGSQDVRTVVAIVPYVERVGLEPTDMEKHFGVSRIAVMARDPRDRRDSSDMLLDEKDRSLFPQDWEPCTTQAKGTEEKP